MINEAVFVSEMNIARDSCCLFEFLFKSVQETGIILRQISELSF